MRVAESGKLALHIVQPASEQVIVQQHAPDAGKTLAPLLRPEMGDERGQVGARHASDEEGGHFGVEQADLNCWLAAGKPVDGKGGRGEQLGQEVGGAEWRAPLVVQVTVGGEPGLVVGVERHPNQPPERIATKRLAVVDGGRAGPGGEGVADGCSQSFTMLRRDRIDRHGVQQRRRAGQVLGQQTVAQELVQHAVDGTRRPRLAIGRAQPGPRQALQEDGLAGGQEHQAFQAQDQLRAGSQACVPVSKDGRCWIRGADVHRDQGLVRGIKTYVHGIQ